MCAERPHALTGRVPYDCVMGFSDGTAAFEARQEAARKKAAASAGLPESEPPVTEFERKLAEARRAAKSAEDEAVQAEARSAQLRADTLDKMALLSVDFSRQADAIGYRPLTVVTARSEVVRTLITNREKHIYKVDEVIGNGWQVDDPDYRSEMGSIMRSFLVMQEGPWITLSPSGAGRAFGEPRGLPRGVDPNHVYAFEGPRGEISYMSYLPSHVEDLMAKALVRAEKNGTSRS